MHDVQQEAKIDSRETTTESTDELNRVQLGFKPVRNDAQGHVYRLEFDVVSASSVRDLTDTLTKMSCHEMDDMELRYCGEILHPDQALKDCISRSGESLQLTKKEPSSDGHVRDTVHTEQPLKDQQVGLVHI